MVKFEKQGFGKRLRTMVKVDFRRMFTMRTFYIITAISFFIPILMTVMVTMMEGSISVNPETGEETISQGLNGAWHLIGTLSGSSATSMDFTSMCNINLVFFIVAVLVALFISEDFKSGYSKNLFTVRSKKSDYVISKTLVGVVSGMIMILAFFVGDIIGSAIAGLSFDMGVAGINGIVMCIIAKMFLIGVFVPIYTLMSVIAKHKTWLSMVLSFGIGLMFFMVIPMVTPLDSTIVNVLCTLIGGIIFSIGLGAVSNVVLNKTSLV